MWARLALLATLLAAGCSSSGGAGWLEGYKYRKRIDIHPPDATALVDFPVAIVAEGDRDLRDAAPDGSDIVITDLDGAVLDYEVEALDPEPGRVAVWVRIPSLAGPTSVWMYYGGDTFPHDPRATWSDRFVAVWHMTDAADGSCPDSTGHGLDIGQTTVDDIPDATKGLAGTARRFNGVYDTLEMLEISGTRLELGTTSFTYCLWARTSGLLSSFDTAIYVGGVSSSDPGFDYELGSSDWRANISDGATIQGAYGVSDGAGVLDRWNQLCAVVDRSADLLHAYGNGAPRDEGDITTIGSLDHSGPLTIGTAVGGSPYAGDLDEIRIYSQALTPAWIAAEYQNLIEPAAFITIGAAESHE